MADRTLRDGKDTMLAPKAIKRALPWPRFFLGFFLTLVILAIPASRCHSVPPSLSELYHSVVQGAKSAANLHFGWGLRDRAWAFARSALEWAPDWFSRMRARLNKGDITTDLGAKEVVYELAEIDGREIRILNIEPFVKVVKEYTGPTTKESRRVYWVTKARVEIKQAEPAGIRTDSFPPLVLGFIIDDKKSSRYAVRATLLDKFLATADPSLIQGTDAFDTHALRDKTRAAQLRLR